MSRSCLPSWLGLRLLVVVFTCNVAAAQSDKSANETKDVGAGDQPVANLVRQGFPAARFDTKDLSKCETAWEIDWTITNPNNGYRDPKSKKRRPNTRPASVLAIRSAKFMYKDRNGKQRWITVLNNLEFGEMFVPYDTTRPTFYDVARHSFYILPAKKEYLGPNCVAPGEILRSSDPRMDNKVLKEVHDDGLRWLNGKNEARRGEKMMLWAVFYGGNYRYLIEYDFSDNGTITCKVGATAHNYFNRQKDQRDVHLHVGCWRFDMQLSDPSDPSAGGPDKNVIKVVRRVPNKKPGVFRLDVSPFNADDDGVAREGFVDWVAKEFTALRIESSVRKNGCDEPQATAYDLLPLRYGSVRDYPKHQDFANHDFWVTHADPKFKLYEKVPTYAQGKRPLQNQPVTIWHSSATMHNPRSEDFGPDGRSRSGAAHTAWAGFILRPRNLFDGTPLMVTSSSVARGKIIFSQKGKLTSESAMDKVRKGAHAEVHIAKMLAGREYTIDLTGRFDTYLRLEDSTGKQLARDDDGGVGRNARLIFQPTKDDNYRIIATTFRPRTTGDYTVTVRELEAAEGR